MSIPFIITVDTEADNQWKGGGDLHVENLKAIPHFQEICERYGFVPTYLVTYEVASDASAVAYLSQLWSEGRAEIGAHLHPWTTPPFFDQEAEARIMHFPSELSDEMLRKKFVTLHETITKVFGRSPKVFRAGRWGYDHRVGDLLTEFGYITDTSITPLLDWGGIVKGGRERRLPNFVHASLAPWKISATLRELPMTIVPRMTRFISRLADKVGRGSLFVDWCRIFPETTAEELLWVYDRAEKLKLPYCMFMIHSSEFIVGSPYIKTPEALAHHFSVFEEFLCALHERGVPSMTVSQVSDKVFS